MKKRIASLLLSLVLILNLIPTSVWAEGLSDTDQIPTEAAEPDTSASEEEETPPPASSESTDSPEKTDEPASSESTDPPGKTDEPASSEGTDPSQETDTPTDSDTSDSQGPTDIPPDDSGDISDDTSDDTSTDPGMTDPQDPIPSDTEDTEDTSSDADSTSPPGTEPESEDPFSFLQGDDWEVCSATRILPANNPMLRLGVPSSTTAYLQLTEMGGITSSYGTEIGRHFIDDGNGYIVQAWCLEPYNRAEDRESYVMDSVLNNQTLKDVLQIAYEWGYWANTASFSPTNIAATALCVWWALGYTSVTCSDSTANSKANSLWAAALADAGCGGGDLYAYECATNSSHQMLGTYYPYRAPTIEYGDIRIKKTSANPSLTDGNSNYSLTGAVYGIYSSRANANADKSRLGTLTTKADGTSNTVTDLEAGYTYFVKEITAPKGYALDTTVYTIAVTANKTATLSVKDTPQSDPVGVLLKKVDATTGKGETCS